VDTTSSDDAPRLSIGEVARLAGVTPRTVRHYHATGLLAEPSRDSPGYRRYGAADLIALVRVVRLRALGMPAALHAATARLAGPAVRAADSPRTRSIVVLLLWGAAALILIACPMMLTEPVMWAYLLDPELLALLVVVGIRYTGLEIALLWLRVCSIAVRRELR
jgi:hypothetical protein